MTETPIPLEPPEDDLPAYDPVLDSEAQLLSAMLWCKDTNALARIIDFLTPADFYRPQYGAVYAAISRLITRGQTHDPASVRVELRARGDKEGLPQSMIDHVVPLLTTLGASDLAVSSYASQVASESYRRQFTRMVNRLKTAAETAPEDQLFTLMVEQGKGQRRAWERYTQFTAPAIATR